MRALITGIFGQDGSYLAELLQEKGYEVHGIEREPLGPQACLLRDCLKQKGVCPLLHSCDLRSYESVRHLIRELRVDECYHLAAVHYPSETTAAERTKTDKQLCEDNIVSTLNVLYAICESSPDTRFVLAGSCLMYEGTEETPQDEGTGFSSRSAYGLSKVVGSQIVSLLRDTSGLHCSTAILYNHESPRRTEHFVTKKIVRNLVKVRNGEISHFALGNLKAIRDWGYAKDYVRGMWLMSQQADARDYVLATGTGHTVEDFVSCAAQILGMADWRDHVREDESLLCPKQGATLIGNPKMATRALGWRASVDFLGLVRIMVSCEVNGTLG